MFIAGLLISFVSLFIEDDGYGLFIKVLGLGLMIGGVLCSAN